MSKTYVFLSLHVYGTPLNRLTDLHTPDDALLTWLQQAQATFLPHLTFTVVIVDSYGETQSAGFGTGAPGRCLDQAVLLPCYRTVPVSFQYYSVNNTLQNGVGWAPLQPAYMKLHCASSSSIVCFLKILAPCHTNGVSLSEMNYGTIWVSFTLAFSVGWYSAHKWQPQIKLWFVKLPSYFIDFWFIISPSWPHSPLRGECWNPTQERWVTQLVQSSGLCKALCEHSGADNLLKGITPGAWTSRPSPLQPELPLPLVKVPSNFSSD